MSCQSTPVKVQALSALVNVEPLVQTMPSDLDPAIRHVWLGHIDGAELVVHPGWMRYCIEVGGEAATLASALSRTMEEANAV